MGIFFSKPTVPPIQESFGFPKEQRDQVTVAIFEMVQKNAPYVGTIILNDGSKGTACLLNDNTIITCLHVVLDYAALIKNGGASPQLIDFTMPNGVVFFAKDSKLYQYNIIGIGINGLENFIHSNASAPASSYDYAILQLDGDPNRDLGGCFDVDPIDHFGKAYASDPRKTLAISGPDLRVSEEGNIEINRFCSIAENLAANGGKYFYQQVGNHYAVFGLSGQAILPMDAAQGYLIGNSVIYAIHSYLDRQTGARIGIKISDYLRFHRASPFLSRTRRTAYLEFWRILNSLITHEVLRSVQHVHAGGSGLVVPGAIINEQRAISLLKSGKSIVADTRDEARAIGITAFGALTKAESHPKSAPRGLPHFHDSKRDYESHVFFTK